MSIDGTLYRQWTMLRLIPRHPRKVSAGDLTNLLNDQGYAVNKRTVERDLKMFEELFGLVADDRSRPYGWQWGHDSSAIDIPLLDDGQALMLLVAEPFVRQLLPPTVLDAISPLLAAARRRLKDSVGAQRFKWWPDKILDTPPTQPLIPAQVAQDVHSLVGMALMRDQWLRIQYRKRGAATSFSFEVQPLGLVTRGPMLYLICRFRGHDDERTIALNRFEHVELLPESFKRPDDFSLKRFVSEGNMGFGDSKLSKVKLRFDRRRGETLIETPLSTDQEIIDDGPNFLLVVATVPLTPELRRWVLGFGAEVEVLEPASLRREVIRSVQRTQAQYRTERGLQRQQ
jgi:predicted DNA-binding transcriptional regulator YafY